MRDSSANIMSMSGIDGSVIARVVAYNNNSVISRFCKEHPEYNKEEAEQIFCELKKFLTIAATSKENGIYSPALAMDHMWHEFIMHSRDYMEFCESNFGRYIHHVPCEEGLRVTNGCKAKKAAIALFGDINPKYWPNKSTTMRCCTYC